jgi:alkylhydroperoxidase family enzyme
VSRGPIDELRAVVESTAPAPAALDAYLARVRSGAYLLTDADTERLRADGLDEDVIFEQTVAAAISEGLRRLDAASAVIG